MSVENEIAARKEALKTKIRDVIAQTEPGFDFEAFEGYLSDGIDEGFAPIQEAEDRYYDQVAAAHRDWAYAEAANLRASQI